MKEKAGAAREAPKDGVAPGPSVLAGEPKREAALLGCCDIGEVDGNAKGLMAGEGMSEAVAGGEETAEGGD